MGRKVRKSKEPVALAPTADEGLTMKKDPYESLVNGLRNGAPLNMYFSKNSHNFVIKQLGDNHSKSVIDIGCGLGLFVKQLNELGFECHGLDVSDAMLEEARKNAPEESLIHDGRDEKDCDSLTGRFDAAYCSLAFHENSSEAQDDLWRQMLSFVKPGGIIIVRDYNIPVNSWCFSTAVGWFFHWEEESYKLVDPDHFEHYKRFVEKGGVEGLFQRKDNDRILRIAHSDHMGGNMRTIVCQKSPLSVSE